jgi:hypothetical protein
MDFNSQDVIVYNALDKVVHVQAFGNHFSFKPHQIKSMRAELGGWIVQQKGYLGLVDLPPQFEDAEYRESEEGKAILASKRQEGLNKKIMALKQQVNNLQVALAYDLQLADMKADINTFATDGDINAMEELLTYQRELQDPNKQRSEAARVKLRQLQAAANAQVNKQPKE